MSTWPDTTTPSRRRELLAPYGKAWRKLTEAYQRKIETLTDEELTELREACTEGRWQKDLSSYSYWASTEVERIVRSEMNSRGI